MTSLIRSITSRSKKVKKKILPNTPELNRIVNLQYYTESSDSTIELNSVIDLEYLIAIQDG